MFKLDSLTVLDYIRTSIEILMHLKNEEEQKTDRQRHHRDQRDDAQSDFTSTFQSLDFPPKEYEQQLQASEAEVRKHVSVE